MKWTLFILIFFLSVNVHAQIYKWTDQNGRVQYSDKAPQDKLSKIVHVENSAGPTALAEVEIEESTIKYYDVYGTNAYELETSMYKNGPFNQIVMQHVIAECGWKFNWKFDYVRDKGQCRIGKFKITLSTEITFPKWKNPQDADDKARDIWARSAIEIRKHEDGHKATGIQAANVLARRLKALPSFDTCEELNAAISREGKQIYHEYSLIDRAFDRTEALRLKPLGRIAE
jgi:predicted secreted Zn-dependent protease